MYAVSGRIEKVIELIIWMINGKTDNCLFPEFQGIKVAWKSDLADSKHSTGHDVTSYGFIAGFVAFAWFVL